MVLPRIVRALRDHLFFAATVNLSHSGIDAVTIGLSSFIDREIEFEVGRLNPSDVLGKVAGLAAHLIEHGNVIKDGDTFGTSDVERIRIRYDVSERFGGLPILRIAAGD